MRYLLALLLLLTAIACSAPGAHDQPPAAEGTARQANDTETGSIELGGSVEVFIDEADARARKQYLDQTLAELPIDVSEYSYLRGPVLLRLSRRLTPDRAAEYKAALDAP